VSDKEKLSYRQVIVGRFPTGFSGLDELFAALYRAGETPADNLGRELVGQARVHNYIPASAEQEFASALLREYRTYWEQKCSGQVMPARAGPRRQQVPWFPMLDETLCDGCDKCLEFCGNSVYAKKDKGIVSVVQPFNCVVGCDACARLCPHKAITFPPRSVLRTLTG